MPTSPPNAITELIGRSLADQVWKITLEDYRLITYAICEPEHVKILLDMLAQAPGAIQACLDHFETPAGAASVLEEELAMLKEMLASYLIGDHAPESTEEGVSQAELAILRDMLASSLVDEHAPPEAIREKVEALIEFIANVFVIDLETSEPVIPAGYSSNAHTLYDAIALHLNAYDSAEEEYSASTISQIAFSELQETHPGYAALSMSDIPMMNLPEAVHTHLQVVQIISNILDTVISIAQFDSHGNPMLSSITGGQIIHTFTPQNSDATSAPSLPIHPIMLSFFCGQFQYLLPSEVPTSQPEAPVPEGLAEVPHVANGTFAAVEVELEGIGSSFGGISGSSH